MSENDSVFTFTIPLEVEIYNPEETSKRVIKSIKDHERFVLLSKEDFKKLFLELWSKPMNSEEIEEFINRHI